MGKTTDTNRRVKRRLIDELNQSSSSKEDQVKRSRVDNRQSGNSSQNSRPQGTCKNAIKANNDLVVRIVTGKNIRRSVLQKNPDNLNLVQIGDATDDHDNRSKVKSKVVIPIAKTKQTRSRIIKPPARFLDTNVKGQTKTGKVTTKKAKVSNEDLHAFDELDVQTNSEIAEGNAAALGRPPIDHDGVELSVHGSDLDEFSDEEVLDQPDETSGEPGEILSSGEEDIHEAQAAAVHNTSQAKKLDKFRHLKDDPDFHTFLNQVLDKKLASQDHQKGRDNNFDNLNQNATRHAPAPRPSKDEQVVQRQVNNVIKSPSDTTLYTPALRRADASQLQNGINAIEKISNFVESIRIDSGNTKRNDRQGFTPQDRINNKKHTEKQSSSSSSTAARRGRIHDAHQFDKAGENREEEDAEHTADQLILQAEKFKARVEAPRGTVNGMNGLMNVCGMNDGDNDNIMPYDYEKLRSKFITDKGLGPIDREIMFLRNFDQDDEFFHVTSQIDPSLKTKIERGEFIDLDKLLPKDKFGTRGSDELSRNLFQLITQGTNTYMSTPDHQKGSNKINSIKKWDQAFRVFAAIYTQANQSRAGEIWQYIYVIHTAAASNPWDNVAYYDVIFRELMASKPWRNWGKTYTQGWNMAFNNNHSYNHGQHPSSFGDNRQNKPQSQQNNGKDWKDDCCWRFNKNKCKRTASECRYDHRCTHCAGWYHSYNNCRKRNNRNNGNGKSNNWNNYNSNNYARTSVSPARQQPVSTNANTNSHPKAGHDKK